MRLASGAARSIPTPTNGPRSTLLRNGSIANTYSSGLRGQPWRTPDPTSKERPIQPFTSGKLSAPAYKTFSQLTNSPGRPYLRRTDQRYSWLTRSNAFA
ncbi:hypothetical protein GDO81_025446 [Engystomops pustulosus]|uniref:Uncharacterized protein n=1 Tax=Engystomops pustulosus TaxID=76066 RepID=A0AAV6YPN1_ENGPU|nr:hypothetical protein GDO81_025446 [Engystomops pustulosus]